MRVCGNIRKWLVRAVKLYRGFILAKGVLTPKKVWGPPLPTYGGIFSCNEQLSVYVCTYLALL
jgi:hypothetical protein